VQRRVQPSCEKHVIPSRPLGPRPWTPFLGHGPPLSLHFNLLHTLRRHSPALACQVAKSNVRSARRSWLVAFLGTHTQIHSRTPSHRYSPPTDTHHALADVQPPRDKVALRFAFYCKLKDFFCLSSWQLKILRHKKPVIHVCPHASVCAVCVCA